MLYNLDWLQTGQQFPPKWEIPRLRKYSDNRLLFDGDIAPGFFSKEEYIKARERVKRIVDNYADIISYPVDANYHRLTSVKTADFVCGEKPIVSLEKPEQTKKLRKLLNKVGFFKKLYTAAIDISRYGDGLLRVYKKGEKNTVAFIDPQTWFRVVEEEDTSETKHHVIAWIVERKQNQYTTENELHVQIHERGSYTKKVFALLDSRTTEYTAPGGQTIKDFRVHSIGAQIGADAVISTGLSDFAIIPLTGLVTSDDVYGKDDYEIIDSPLAEVWARLGQISIILDKHSSPDYYAPESAFMQNQTGPRKGEYTLKTGGRAYVVAEGQQPPGMITWDGQLTANFNMVNLLMEQVYKLSEMGAVFEAALTSSNISYDTMRAKFISALKKAERITGNIDEQVKKAIALVTELGGDRVSADDISIEWCDGLPDDESTEIDNAVKLIGAGMSTPEIENVERFGKTQERAEEISEAVREYMADSAMAGYGSRPPREGPEEDEEDEEEDGDGDVGDEEG